MINLGRLLGLVGPLQCAREELIFRNGELRVFAVDTGAAKKEEFCNIVLIGRMNDIGQDHDVVVEELCGIGIIGQELQLHCNF